MIAIPTEICAAAILITFWDDDVSRLSADQIFRSQLGDRHSNAYPVRQPNHAPAYIAAILVVMISFNLFGVRYFGESEFFFCLVKSEVFTFASLRRSLTVCEYLKSR